MDPGPCIGGGLRDDIQRRIVNQLHVHYGISKSLATCADLAFTDGDWLGAVLLAHAADLEGVR